MVNLSPKATVPVLALSDGQVIDESLDIMRWALGQNDPLGWLERDDAALIAVNDEAFKHHLDRYKYPQRHTGDPLEHRTTGLALLGALEARLVQNANLGGEVIGLTDAALLPFVRQFAEVDRVWFDAQPLPGLQRWLSQHLASPLFVTAMIRFKPWQPNDTPLALPLMPNFA